jgi:hypothetical protein
MFIIPDTSAIQSIFAAGRVPPRTRSQALAPRCNGSGARMQKICQRVSDSGY